MKTINYLTKKINNLWILYQYGNNETEYWISEKWEDIEYLNRWNKAIKILPKSIIIDGRVFNLSNNQCKYGKYLYLYLNKNKDYIGWLEYRETPLEAIEYLIQFLLKNNLITK